MSFPTRTDLSFWAHKKAPSWGQGMAGTKPSIDSVVNSHLKRKTPDHEREWGNTLAVLRLKLKEDSLYDALVSSSYYGGHERKIRSIRLIRRLYPGSPHLTDQLLKYVGQPRDLIEGWGKFSDKAKAAYKARGKELQAKARALREIAAQPTRRVVCKHPNLQQVSKSCPHLPAISTPPSSC